ncbi:hypothetical protein ACFOY2_46235 [Nonomuraea purpurea]|uniref:Uncharacterized protein n=1 Tax=Nonomuraea purpurea TaxID=1849276 RepID=A0ABV8GP37_9ACTN
MKSTHVRATRYALLAALVVTYGLGVMVLVLDDNYLVAYALFWAVCWMFVGWRHLDQIDRVRLGGWPGERRPLRCARLPGRARVAGRGRAGGPRPHDRPRADVPGPRRRLRGLDRRGQRGGRHTRWESHHSLIIRNEAGEHFQGHYRQGLTEYQDTKPWEYEKTARFDPVVRRARVVRVHDWVTPAKNAAAS